MAATHGKGRPGVLFLLVGLITLCVFLPSLQNGFVDWDDDKNLLNNLSYRGLGPAQLRWMWTTFHLGPYQPLSWMTCGFDYVIWGMRPFGYHLTSVLLHALGAGLFAAVGARLFLLGPLNASGAEASSAGSPGSAEDQSAESASSTGPPRVRACVDRRSEGGSAAAPRVGVKPGMASNMASNCEA